MARFAGLGLEPILADSDDDEGDMAFRRGGFGMRGGDNHNGKGGNDAVRGDDTMRLQQQYRV